MILISSHSFLIEAYFAQLDTRPPEVNGYEVSRSNDNFGVKRGACPPQTEGSTDPSLVRGCIARGICASKTLNMIGQRSEFKGQDVQMKHFLVCLQKLNESINDPDFLAW